MCSLYSNVNLARDKNPYDLQELSELINLCIYNAVTARSFNVVSVIC